MVVDRLAEFKKRAASETIPLIDVVANKDNADDGGVDMVALTLHVQPITNQIPEIKKHLDDIAKIQTEILTTPGDNSKKEKILNDLSIKAKKSLNTIENDICALPEKAKSHIHQCGSQKGREILKGAWKGQYSYLSSEVKKLRDHQYTLNSNFTAKRRANIKRKIKIIGENASEQQIDDMIATGNYNIFSGSITGEKDFQKELAQLEKRHLDITRLEKSIEELHDLFLEMSNRIAQQGKLIDDIETKVMIAVDEVDKGTRNVIEANKQSKKLGKTTVIIGTIAAVFLTASIVILIVELM